MAFMKNICQSKSIHLIIKKACRTPIAASEKQICKFSDYGGFFVNNLVFNTTASQLKTAIYAEAPDTSLQPIKIDASQNLLASVSGTVTVSEITSAVTIGNTSLTIDGTVTVAEVTNPITIGNTSLTIDGTVTVAEVTNPITIGNTSLTIDGTVTVAEVTNPITIGNTSLTIDGTVTVSEITNPVTIGNTSLTIDGTVTVSEITNPVTIGNTSLTVAGTVTVAEVTAPVTIGNASLTVAGTVTTFSGGSSATSIPLSATSITGTGVLFANTNISAIKTKSFFLYNGGTNTITLSLQYSPTTTTTDYIDDAAYTNVAIAGGASQYIAATGFGWYMRLEYNMGATSETISGYLITQA